MHAREHAGRLHSGFRLFIFVQRENDINYSCGHLLFKKRQHFLVTLCLNASTSRSTQIRFPSYIEIKYRSSTIRPYTAAGKLQYHLQIK